jgi:N-acetylmuramoyl-L-alanine amidase
VIAVCVGHSRPGGGGAISVDETSEHHFNCDLAERISLLLERAGEPHQVYDRYRGKTYPQAMKWLAEQLRADGAIVAAELHFNWSDARAASGHEWWYWQHSAQGKTLAACLDRSMRAAFPKALARGIKAAGPRDNGAAFLRMMPCPACIAEPFFGSSAHDWETVAGRPEVLADAIAEGLRAARRKIGGRA